jgi:cytochrome P450
VRLCLGSADIEVDQQIEVPGDGRARAHCAFGAGQHRCLGSYLALAAVRILIAEWLERTPDFDLAPDFTPRLELRGSRVDTLAELPRR